MTKCTSNLTFCNTITTIWIKPFFINTYIPQKINKHELYVLTLHEGIPGHHYEVNLHINMDRPDYFKSSSEAKKLKTSSLKS